MSGRRHFSGVSESLTSASSRQIRRPQMTEEIGLAQGYTGIAQDRVGRRHMKEEVRKSEAREILAAQEAIAAPVREFEHDFAILATRQGRRVKLLDIGDRPVASYLKLRKALFGIGHRR